MAGHRDTSGVYQSGIEDLLPNTQYSCEAHQGAVAQDIADNWITLSQGSKFHAIFATSSIAEAIVYYRLIKSQCPNLKITALFDPNISDEDGGTDPVFKTNGLVEILADYNHNFGQKFDLGTHANFKKDLAARLAHKEPYVRIEVEPDKRLDLLIVVNQMLTGFDSKWVNTLYLDKLLEYENIIQAFSRTNRLFGPDKPFGTIRYYRAPHSMTRNIAAAVKLYSGDKAIGLFVDRLPDNLLRLNASFAEICAIFTAAGVENFMKLPDDLAARAAFAKKFIEFNKILEAAKIQSFTWDKAVYVFEEPKRTIELTVTEQQYYTLLQRYKELSGGGGGGGGGDDIPFEIDTHITEIDTGKIDTDYMNLNFEKYLKVLQTGDESARESTLAELHRSFSSLSQEDQKFAAIFLHDIQRGDMQIDPARTFRDYLNDYKARAKNKEVEAIVKYLGVDAGKLRALMSASVTDANLDEYGRFADLTATVDKPRAKAYFEALEGQPLPAFKVNIKAAALLKKFILAGGFELLGESPATIEVAVVGVRFAKPGNASFTTEEKDLCASESIQSLQAAFASRQNPNDPQFVVSYLAEYEGSLEIALKVAAVGGFISFSGGLANALQIVGVILEEWGNGHTVNGQFVPNQSFVQTGKWFQKAAWRLTPKPTELSGTTPAGAPVFSNRIPKPGCYGKSEWLILGSVRCGPCGFLPECKKIARPT